MNKWLKKVVKGIIIATAVGCTVVFCVKPMISQGQTVKETAELRFIFTTDLHGQLNSKDYETGLDYGNGGLARAYDLIMKARNEVATNNSFTFDVGDFLYDYTTEYIFSENQEEIQPILRGMSVVGYDAITLGNHEFDYGYNYLINQLNGSGMMEKVVLSNVFDSKTGKTRFKENMIINRQVKTTSGKTAEVKVGIIGETIPHLTAKTESYVGILKVEDIVKNVKEQSKKLKEQGADIVIVLSHSGIGVDNPELNFKNVSYELTKIEEVDVVLCGHEHRNFPTTDKTSPYLALPGVDQSTFLVNGKNLIMANDRGSSIGVVDMDVSISGSDVEIKNRKSSLRYVSDYDTTEHEEIRSLYGYWEMEFAKYANDVIGELNKGEKLQNFAGILEDTSAIQLINDAKRSHALRYINTVDTKYKDYPVVAVSGYYSYGENGEADYVNISDKFTESDLAILQPYNNYLYLYEITGAQLREWLEWSASAYETSKATITWNDSTMKSLMSSTSLNPLIKEEWTNNWNNFYIFDGVSYTIDRSKEGRYDYSGNKVSDSKRVGTIMYNGKLITDATKLVIASNKITGPTEANKGIETQYLTKTFARTQAVLSDYIKTISKAGSILPTPDNNWTLNPTGSEYIVKLPEISKEIAKNRPWYVSELKTIGGFTYYKAREVSKITDLKGPNIYLVPGVIESTGVGFDVVVNALDESGIKTLKYRSGDVPLHDPDWYLARDVVDNKFNISANGTYSVYAEDTLGNKSVKTVVIDNISDKVIATPKVETYTNRKTAIKGTAEPNTNIIISAYTGTYITKTFANGKFSYALPAQPSGTKVTIYAQDEVTERKSAKVTVNVKRTGPNQPKVNYIYNNTAMITGSLNDTDGELIVFAESNVYVDKTGGREKYLNAKDIYDKSYNIIETDMTIEDGKFAIDIPYLTSGVTVDVYNVDHLNRVSRSTTVVVSENGPNVPITNGISSLDKTISGIVTSNRSNIVFDVYVEVNGRVYEGTTDKEGQFIIPINEQLQSSQVIYVYAEDVYKGVTRVSGIDRVIVDDSNSLVVTNPENLVLNPMHSKEKVISGYYEEGNTNINIAIETSFNGVKTNVLYDTITDEDGNYELELNDPLAEGTTVYAIVRFADGDILAVNKIQVTLAKPEKPYVISPINNSQKIVYVVTDKDSTVTVALGDKKYTETKYVYDNDLNIYLYAVNVGRVNSGTAFKVYAKNATGYSSVYSGVVKKVTPDAPIVSNVTTNDTTIQGRVDVMDTSRSKTVVYAKIGKKNYKAYANEDGTFSINIKNQKVNTAISVWAYYNKKIGPATSVKVSQGIEIVE